MEPLSISNEFTLPFCVLFLSSLDDVYVLKSSIWCERIPESANDPVTDSIVFNLDFADPLKFSKESNLFV